METKQLLLDTPLLEPEIEFSLANTIEVGVLASDKLAQCLDADLAAELKILVDEGERAWDEFFKANLRLAMWVAKKEANRYESPLEDVFQEACLGLADAIQRWDHRRGLRFSTFAVPWIRYRASSAALTKGGQNELSANRIRSQINGSSSRVDVVAVSPDLICQLGISTPPEDPFADTSPWWFIELADIHQQVLALRYGIEINGVPTKRHTIAEVAEKLRVSYSQVRRLEAAALRRTKELISQVA
ncbi:MAG: hypothetical protein CR979_01905 [Propionibacterium sp.]|nr:MAG: hypothetical protein CR979_01905 [Propionibacterium sp.]